MTIASKRLLLIRDRFGIKPLYYRRQRWRDRLGIGSEIDPEASRYSDQSFAPKRHCIR